MTLPLDLQIQQEVSRYLAQAISLNDFYDWFVPRSWDIEECGNLAAIGLAHRIDGLLGEWSSAEWSEADLRQQLANAIRPFERRTLSVGANIPAIPVARHLAARFEIYPKPAASELDLTLQQEWLEIRRSA